MSEQYPVLLCNQCGKEMRGDKHSFPTLGNKGVFIYSCTCGHQKLLNVRSTSQEEIEAMNEDVRNRF